MAPGLHPGCACVREGVLMLYQVFIAICLTTMAHKDCDIHNAVD